MREWLKRGIGRKERYPEFGFDFIVGITTRLGTDAPRFKIFLCRNHKTFKYGRPNIGNIFVSECVSAKTELYFVPESLDTLTRTPKIEYGQNKSTCMDTDVNLMTDEHGKLNLFLSMFKHKRRTFIINNAHLLVIIIFKYMVLGKR